MALSLASLADLAGTTFDDIIDVRAPAEFAEDHVPGAINLPVLDDDERARVGTLYVRVDKFLARKTGAALVARNAAAHIEGPLADRGGGWRPLVYCWRGGQRSGSFASILSQIGWKVETLEGGYRSYRRLVVSALRDGPLPFRFILLDGNTGTAKTELLGLLAARGHQVIDLEGLGRHRGSVFGHMGGQPTQKGFESGLAMALARLDPARPVIVEAESPKIGNLQIPSAVWAAMVAAPRIILSSPLEERARYLVRAYADVVADGARLDRTLASLVPLQGHETVARWQAMAAAGQVEALAQELMSFHYDPRYLRSRRKHPVSGTPLDVPRLTPEGLDAAAGEIDRLIGAGAADILPG